MSIEIVNATKSNYPSLTELVKAMFAWMHEYAMNKLAEIIVK